MKHRMLVVKILTIAILIVAVMSRSVYGENTLASLVLEVLSYTLLMFSALGRAWAGAYISGKKTMTLVAEGPYSIVRNPLYFFSFLGFIGTGLAFGSVIIAVALAVVFFATHWPTILREEGNLRQVFGQDFDSYCQKVPRFIPKPSQLINPKEISFEPAVYSLAIAHCTLIAMVFILARIVQWCHLHDLIPVWFHLV